MRDDESSEELTYKKPSPAKPKPKPLLKPFTGLKAKPKLPFFKKTSNSKSFFRTSVGFFHPFYIDT